MKIVTVVGARPQFVKAAAVSRVIRSKVNEILVHTGQHYDQNMSDIFFEELQIPKPDYNLGIGSGSHAQQTGQMMIEIEKVLVKEKPDYCMVYGDTNSTLAAAIAGVKLHIPIIHIEAGLRSYNNRMPEEINRILTDRVSHYLFCPTETAVVNLAKEGITTNVFNIGDVMCDAVMYYSKLIDNYGNEHFFHRLQTHNNVAVTDKWYLATIHRAENTDDLAKIEQILAAFEELDYPVIFPVHPRTIGMVNSLVAQNSYTNILLTKPVGYIDMLFFTKNAEKVVTDSGGLQKEAYLLNTPCVTVRDQTEWTETLIGGYNVLTKPNKNDILRKVKNAKIDSSKRQEYYGRGDAATKLLKVIMEANI